MSSTARTVLHFWDDQRGELARHAGDLASSPSPETVHDLRAAGRRIRTTVRAFRPLLRSTLADRLVTGFGEVNQALGDVRDAEVVCDLVARVAGPEDPLTVTLTTRRDGLRASAAELLASDRTAGLLVLVDELTERPWKGRYGKNGPPGRMFAERVDRTEQRVGRAWQALVTMEDAVRAGARDAAGTDLDAQSHLLRRRAKAARFTLDAVHRHGTASRYARVSDLLGLVQDAVVVRELLGDRTDDASRAAVAEAQRAARKAQGEVTAALRTAVPEELWAR